MYPITNLTSSILAIIFILISIQTIKFRHKYKVSIGAKGHEDLEMTIRAHANFAEYTPITLILLLCAEANHANWVVLFTFAALFIIGRLCHAYAFIANIQHFKFRKRGMYLTFTCIFCLSFLNVSLVIMKAFMA